MSSRKSNYYSAWESTLTDILPVLASGSVFNRADAARELRQAEIISNLTEYSFDPETEEVDYETHSFCVVLSQDCDLLRDYEDRQQGKSSPLNGVLVFLARPATDLRDMVKGSDIRKRIIQNNDERYHVLEATLPDFDALGEGLPALVIDFRRFFTLPAKSVYFQCSQQDGAKRRCALSSPYREHLQSRLAFYLARVALPTPHNVAA